MTTSPPFPLAGITEIIVHKDCPDGLIAAILLQDALPGVPIRFIQYQTDELRDLVPHAGMLFCDFSPPAEAEKTAPYALTELGKQQIRKFVDAGVRILDHHKSAKEAVSMFGNNGRFGDETLNPGVCGATLAYDHVWRAVMIEREAPGLVDPKAPPATDPSVIEFVKNFARLAGVRDTWQKKDPDWQTACAQALTLLFYPKETWLGMSLRDLAVQWDKVYAPLGEILLAKEAKGVQRAVDGGYRFTTAKGTRVIVFEGIKKTSDAAEVAKDVDVIVGFGMFIPSDKKAPVPDLIFSCRSRGGYDVSAFAKSLGGGGHTAAAGFKEEVVIVDPTTSSMMGIEHRSTSNPYSVIWALLEKFESKRPGMGVINPRGIEKLDIRT